MYPQCSNVEFFQFENSTGIIIIMKTTTTIIIIIIIIIIIEARRPGFQVTGMIEWSKNSRPKKIPRASSKTQKNSWTKT